MVPEVLEVLDRPFPRQIPVILSVRVYLECPVILFHLL